MKGFGTVVTGTLISGTIRREEELEVFPAGRKVRVRGVQVHGQAADAAVAGQRTALNLAGASTEDLSRGMTLAPPATYTTTRRVDVQLSLLPTAPRPLKSRTRVHFHSNTMETVAEIALHSVKQLAPGSQAFARLEASGGGAVASRRPVHPPPVLAGRDDRRRRCAGSCSHPADARTRRLPADTGRRRSGTYAGSADRKARTSRNHDVTARR